MVKKTTMKKFFIFAFIVFSSFKGFTQAPLKVFCPVIADATIDQYQKNIPFGNNSGIIFYPRAQGFKKRFLIKFDLSNIPAGAKIISAQIQLRPNNFAGNNFLKTPFDVHKVNKKWDESSVTWSNFQNSFKGSKTSSKKIRWRGNQVRERWNVTNDVKGIFDGTSENFGWIFKERNLNRRNFFSFYSKEHGVQFSPRLKITYEVPQNPTLQISKGQKNITCNGLSNGEANVTVTGGNNQGYNYIWSPTPPNGQNTPSVTGLLKGTWSLKIEDAADNTISKTVSFTITEPNKIAISTVTTNATCFSCNDGIITLNATGGSGNYNYSINDAQFFQSGNVFTGLSTGSYAVFVKDDKNCSISGSESHSVGYDVTPLELSLLPTQPECNSLKGSLISNVSGGVGPYAYLWGNGETSSNLSNIGEGTYSLTVTDFLGNTIDTSINLSPIGAKANWTNAQDITENSDGSFTSTSPSSFARIFSDNVLKSGENGFVEMDVPFDYARWQVGFELINSKNTIPYVQYGIVLLYNQVWIVHNGIMVKYIKIFDSSSKMKVERDGSNINYYWGDLSTPVYKATAAPSQDLIAAVNIQENNKTIPQPELSFAGCPVVAPVLTANILLDTICRGDTSFIALTGADSYIWSPSNGLNTTTGSDVLASPTSSTTYRVIGTSNGLSDTLFVQINVPILPIIVVNKSHPNHLCVGDSLELTAIGGNDYVWSPSVGLNNTLGPVVKVGYTTSGLKRYFVEGVSNEGCLLEKTEVKFLNSSGGGVVDLGADTTICPGDSIKIGPNQSNNFGYNWNTGEQTRYITVKDSGEYIINFRNTANPPFCLAEGKINIGLKSKPSLSVNSLSSSIKQGDTTSLTVSGGDNYLWTPADGLSNYNTSQVYVSPSKSTIYTVTGTSVANECKDTATFYLEVINIASVYNDFYLTLQKKLDNRYSAIETDLKFIFNVEYESNTRKTLNYSIKNKERKVVYSSDNLSIPVTRGTNKISIPDIAQKLGNSGYYVLEVTNKKDETYLLRFKI